jgi:excisionase family DNA binding protein
MDNGKEFLTVEEFSTRTRFHANTVVKMIKSGKIKAFSSCKGRNYRIPHTEVERLIEMQTTDMLLKSKGENYT